MRLPVSTSIGVQVDFRRVVKDEDGKPGKTHLTVNKAPICGKPSHDLIDHPSGWEHQTAREFVQTPCLTCYKQVSRKTVEEAKAELGLTQVA